MDIVTKREREKETVSLMVRLYCRKKHHSKTLCPDCAALDAYGHRNPAYEHWLRGHGPP